MNEAARTYDPAEYISIKEISSMLGLSTSTIRRHARLGTLGAVEWVDVFNTGRLRAKRKTVLEFIKNRQVGTAQEMNLRPRRKR